jgi:hypothetical protein
MMARFQQSGSSGRQRRAVMVWIEDKGGKLMPVFIRTGVTDNMFTEIVRGDLKEGQLVITGLNGTSGTNSQNNPSRDLRRGMMFIGR